MRLILVALIALCPFAAIAGGMVQQSGKVTPGHVPAIITNGLIGDGGPALSGNIKELGITANGGTPFCITNNPISRSYAQMCLGLSDQQAYMTLGSYSGEPPLPLRFVINGTTYDFPISVGGITGPNSSPISTLTAWNNTTGSLLGNTAINVTQNSGIAINPGNFTPTNGYSASGATAASVLGMSVLGSSSLPNNTSDAAQIVQKWSIGGADQASYTSIINKTPLVGSRHTAALFEAQDSVGGNPGPYVEGSRSQAFLQSGANNGSAYGSISVAYEANGVPYSFLIGHESEVDNTASDAPDFLGTISTAFNATSNGSHQVSAAYLVNPNTTLAARFNNGFWVPAGAFTSPVSFSAFRSDALAVWGLDLTQMPSTGGAFGAIGLPNNLPIRAENSAHTGALNVLALDGANTLTIGNDPGINLIQLGSGGAITTLVGGDLNVGGHLSFTGGGITTVSACGVGPTFAGHDSAGAINVGAGGVGSCAVTFAVAFAHAPYCVVTPNRNFTVWVPTVSMTGFTVQSTSDMSGASLYFHCSDG